MTVVPRDDASDAPRCRCGSLHRGCLELLAIEDDALGLLVDFVAGHGWSRPLAVMDANTEEVAGARVVGLLRGAGLAVGSLCFPDRSGLLADEEPVARLESGLASSSPDVIVAVGSGVVTDLARYVAGGHGLEFVSVPTAASMDGYASGVAVMEFGGIKASFPAPPPRAIFAEPRTLASAPLEMTRSGIGDLLGKASAGADWVAAHLFCGEPRCPEVAAEVDAAVVAAALDVDEIMSGSAPSAAGLLRGLVVSGTAIAKVGSSRPASGSEHQVSHFWDLMAANGRRPHFAHGLQVGYATQFAMRLQLFAFAGAIRNLAAPAPALGGAELQEFFSGHEAEVTAVLEEKRRVMSASRPSWPAGPSQWEEVRAGVGEAMGLFPVVAGALASAGIPAEPGFLGLDRDDLKASFRWANRIRSRFSVLDFLEGQGRLDEGLETIFASG